VFIDLRDYMDRVVVESPISDKVRASVQIDILIAARVKEGLRDGHVGIDKVRCHQRKNQDSGCAQDYF
jgi:hypothetical protein